MDPLIARQQLGPSGGHHQRTVQIERSSDGLVRVLGAAGLEFSGRDLKVRFRGRWVTLDGSLKVPHREFASSQVTHRDATHQMDPSGNLGIIEFGSDTVERSEEPIVFFGQKVQFGDSQFDVDQIGLDRQGPMIRGQGLLRFISRPQAIALERPNFSGVTFRLQRQTALVFGFVEATDSQVHLPQTAQQSRIAGAQRDRFLHVHDRLLVFFPIPERFGQTAVSAIIGIGNLEGVSEEPLRGTGLSSPHRLDALA